MALTAKLVVDRALGPHGLRSVPETDVFALSAAVDFLAARAHTGELMSAREVSYAHALGAAGDPLLTLAVLTALGRPSLDAMTVEFAELVRAACLAEETVTREQETNPSASITREQPVTVAPGTPKARPSAPPASANADALVTSRSPAKRLSATRFRPVRTRDRRLAFMSISRMPEFSDLSCEELRWREYMLARGVPVKPPAECEHARESHASVASPVRARARAPSPEDPRHFSRSRSR